MNNYLFIYVFNYLFICVVVCLFVWLSIYLFIYLLYLFSSFKQDFYMGKWRRLHWKKMLSTILICIIGPHDGKEKVLWSFQRFVHRVETVAHGNSSRESNTGPSDAVCLLLIVRPALRINSNMNIKLFRDSHWGRVL